MSTGFTETSSIAQAVPTQASSAPGDGASRSGDGAEAGAVIGSALTCTSCGAANAEDSRFCRLCGASMRVGDAQAQATPPAATALRSASEATVFDSTLASGATVPGAVSSPAAQQGAVGRADPVAAAPAYLVDAASTSSGTAVPEGSPEAVPVVSEADARRARQLLDRAFTLVERGDMANAILSCRQSVALAPHAPQGFSMLGLLLERTGDLEQAAAAYARVLRLAPDSRLEMESLERIRATLNSRRGEAPAFRFDERELDEALASAPPEARAFAAGATVAAGVAAAAPGPPQESAVYSSAIPASVVGRPPGGVPVPTAGATRSSVNTTAPAPEDYPNSPLPLIVGGAAGAAPSVSALHFDLPDAEDEPWWRSALARPSAFSRGLPLAGVAGLGLLFLIWARGAAVSRYPQDSQLPSNVDSTSLNTGNVPPIPNSTAPFSGGSTSAVAPALSSPGAPSSGAPAGVAGPNDAYPVSNRPGAPAGPAPSANGQPPAGAASTNQNGGAQNTGGNRAGGSSSGPGQQASAPQRPQPVFPGPGRMVAPANPNALAPARPLPAPAVSYPAAPVQRPGGLMSGGGGPLGPPTSSNRDVITLTPPRSPAMAPPRVNAARNDAEAAAVRAGSSRRPDAAITSSSQAIRNGGETGWNYQQRALAFLTRGDNQRAADDFQLAISAYNDQIARGDRVDEARGGVSACRAGLALALQRMGR